MCPLEGETIDTAYLSEYKPRHTATPTIHLYSPERFTSANEHLRHFRASSVERWGRIDDSIIGDNFADRIKT